MAGGVKRAYSSSVRAEGARRTRALVVAAATDLFVHKGFDATSIAEVAAAAGVARPTVLATFGSKPALLKAVLDEALAALPEAQRRAFVLHVEGELSYREVADVMKISIGTVMSRLFYARQKLRAILSRRVEV